MRPSDLHDLVNSLSLGDWFCVSGIDPEWVSGLIRNTPQIVIAPAHVMLSGRMDPVTTGIAVGLFGSNQSSNRIITALSRHPSGSKIYVPTKIRHDGIDYRDGYIIAIPSMRFSSHAVLAIKS